MAGRLPLRGPKAGTRPCGATTNHATPATAAVAVRAQLAPGPQKVISKRGQRQHGRRKGEPLGPEAGSGTQAASSPPHQPATPSSTARPLRGPDGPTPSAHSPPGAPPASPAHPAAACLPPTAAGQRHGRQLRAGGRARDPSTPPRISPQKGPPAPGRGPDAQGRGRREPRPEGAGAAAGPAPQVRGQG